MVRSMDLLKDFDRPLQPEVLFLFEALMEIQLHSLYAFVNFVFSLLLDFQHHVNNISEEGFIAGLW